MERINNAIREHEVSIRWEYRPVAEELYRWFDIFNSEFFEGKLPTPFLQFDRARRSNLGHYRPGRNRVGAQHEINMNHLHLGRPLGEVLGTLWHEVVHEWQDIFGKSGKGNYHNKEFTAKCAALGIPCTGGYNSYSIGHTDPFVSLLRRHGIDMQALLSAPAPTTKTAGSSKLKKWSYGCTNIRAAVTVQAQCLRCGGIFQRAD